MTIKTFFTGLLLVGLTLHSGRLLGQRWYKGNLHTHSLWSDGDDYPEPIMAWYKANGYQFVGLSDHNTLQEGEKWIQVPKAKERRRVFERYLNTFGKEWVTYQQGPNDSLRVRLKTLAEYRPLFEEKGTFLILNSEEISDSYQGKPIHINVTNVQRLIRPQRGNSVAEVMQNNLNAVVAQRRLSGQPVFAHINHPNFYYAITADDLKQLRHERFFEVYNGHPLVYNYGDNQHPGTEQIWDEVNAHYQQLGRPLLYGLATDDSHNYHYFGLEYSNTGRGWVMVNAAELTPKALTEALEAGRFYATTGVELSEYIATEKLIRLSIKPETGVTYRVQFIGLREGMAASQVLEEVEGLSASYALRPTDRFVRAKVISSKPKFNPYFPNDVETAWTQPVGPSVVPAALPNVVPLRNAHAHNDYEQSRALWDALDHGFTSVEADVYLINDTLFVAHDRPTFTNPDRTLEKLYFKPLAERIRQQGGSVYPGSKAPFYLMIDFKTEAEATYRALEKLLGIYGDIFTTCQGKRCQSGPVTLFISGNRPIEQLVGAKQRAASLDGRPADLGKGYAPQLMPVVSEAYYKVTTHRGTGPMPADELAKVRSLAERAHREGKKLRLWATPEDPELWAQLLDAGLDFINTDQLELAREFLLSR